MLRCTLDIAIPNDSQCAICCLYCNDKEKCKYSCQVLSKCQNEDEVVKYCVYAFEEE